MKNIATVVMPCYNESNNVDFLINEFCKADLNHSIKRIIYVDDNSPDNTSELIKSLNFPIDVVCIHRIGRQGLSSAVTEGILLADTKYVIVMDADGQHLPFDALRMLNVAISKKCQLVIGSRFLNQPRVSDHVGYRARLSEAGNWLANYVLKRNLTDPLTGFFLIERSLFNQIANRIRGSGFKILVDIIFHLRGKSIKDAEIQIEFKSRMHGESKLDSSVLFDFVDQLLGLFLGKFYPDKFLGFLVVGLVGVFIHFIVLYIFLFPIGFAFSLAQMIGALIAMISNFTLNNLLTFRRNRLRGFEWLRGLASFIFFCSLGLVANVGVSSFLYGNNALWWLSGIAGIIIGTAFNFTMSKNYIWSGK